MKKRFTEEQIVRVLKEAEGGVHPKEIVRKYGICEQTFYKWKRKYGGMEVSDARKLKSLEEENKRLKKIVAEQALDIDTCKELLRKNF